jgi:hypothetical protein
VNIAIFAKTSPLIWRNADLVAVAFQMNMPRVMMVMNIIKNGNGAGFRRAKMFDDISVYTLLDEIARLKRECDAAVKDLNDCGILT